MKVGNPFMALEIYFCMMKATRMQGWNGLSPEELCISYGNRPSNRQLNFQRPRRLGKSSKSLPASILQGDSGIGLKTILTGCHSCCPILKLNNPIVMIPIVMIPLRILPDLTPRIHPKMQKIPRILFPRQH